MSQRISLSASIALVLVGLSLPGAALHAQYVRHLRNTTYVGVGYVANVPNTFLGGSVLALTPKVLGGAGVYADVKVSLNSPRSDPEFAPGWTLDQAELTYGDAEFTNPRDIYFSTNFALVYAITPELLVYGGAGYTKKDHYRHFYDDQEVRGIQGWYWVLDTDNSGTYLNALGGVFFRLTRNVLFQAGGESKPGGVTLGCTIVLPF